MGGKSIKLKEALSLFVHISYTCIRNGDLNWFSQQYG